MMPTPSEEPSLVPSETAARSSNPSHDPATSADCRTCELRARCISWGWTSPGGIWFENAVMLAPKRGCRGFVGRGADIRSHFARARAEAAATEAETATGAVSHFARARGEAGNS